MKLKKILLCLFLPFILKAQSSEKLLEFISLLNSDENEEVACYRIPSIAKANNGDLIAVIDERVPSCGDLKWSKDINIVGRRSKDNGETWTPIEIIVDYPFGKSASDPSMIVDKITGEIFLFFNYMDLDKEKDVYYFKMISSIDHGKTWSSPIDITNQISKLEWKQDFKFITSGEGIQTDSGTLLHTMVNLKNGLHLFASDDHGKNWYLIDTPILPGDESKVVELADGSWMVNSRVSKKGMRYVHRSINQGKTWISNPEPQLVDPACNASIIRYTSIKNGSDKNRLLFSNANSSDSRENLSIRISYDEGKTWSKAKTVYAGKAAYSSMCILSNGDIGLFFEKDEYKENAFVRLTLDWLSNGKDELK